ncbi:MAG: hypothetical protein JST85_24805 [Acidobacteria bacterium]|nr:hypothetical protein [Acidobacteriota bacterium]
METSLLEYRSVRVIVVAALKTEHSISFVFTRSTRSLSQGTEGWFSGAAQLLGRGCDQDGKLSLLLSRPTGKASLPNGRMATRRTDSFNPREYYADQIPAGKLLNGSDKNFGDIIRGNRILRTERFEQAFLVKNFS